MEYTLQVVQVTVINITHTEIFIVGTMGIVVLLIEEGMVLQIIFMIICTAGIMEIMVLM